MPCHAIYGKREFADIPQESEEGLSPANGSSFRAGIIILCSNLIL